MTNNQNPVSRRFGRCIVALGAVFVSLSAYAQNAIESVSGSIQGGVEVIRVDLAQPLNALPAGFSIQVPARIALDFPGVSNGLGRPSVDINQGNLKTVNVVQAGDRTRLVLNLKQATSYKTELRGKSLLVTLEPVAVAAPAAATAVVFAENRNLDVLPIKDMDFRRGAERAGGRAAYGL